MNIKLLILDVDGTLTDGKIYVDNDKNSLKAFDVKDGFAIVQWLKFSGEIAILTGKESKIVERRSKELGIKYVIQGSKDKVSDLNDLLKKLDIKKEECAYIGDDLNDIAAMRMVAFSSCPADAIPEVKNIVNYISNKNGGNGAVREIIEYLMKKNNTWNEVLKKYL